MMRRSGHKPTLPPQSGDQDLVFVTVSQPQHLRNHAIQKRIRNHVMSQVGRSRRKKPKFPTVELALLPSADETTTSMLGNEAQPVTDSYKNPIVPRPLFPYGIYAVDPTPRARELIHFSMHAIQETCDLSFIERLSFQYMSKPSTSIALSAENGSQWPSSIPAPTTYRSPMHPCT